MGSQAILLVEPLKEIQISSLFEMICLNLEAADSIRSGVGIKQFPVGLFEPQPVLYEVKSGSPSLSTGLINLGSADLDYGVELSWLATRYAVDESYGRVEAIEMVVKFQMFSELVRPSLLDGSGSDFFFDCGASNLYRPKAFLCDAMADAAELNLELLAGEVVALGKSGIGRILGINFEGTRNASEPWLYFEGVSGKISVSDLGPDGCVSIL